MSRYLIVAALSAGVGLAVSAQPLLAQGAPTNITAPPPAQAAPAAPETPQQLTEKINRGLNGMSTLVADFTQINADGRRRAGKLYVSRPGRLRFDYNPPSQIEIVSDGKSVAVIDKKVPQQDIYGINQTPLKFLVRERIDISKDTKVLSVRRDKDEVILDIEDSNTLAGTSKIRIHFNGESFLIRRWTVTDPRGVPTTIQLANLNTRSAPDRQLFQINYQFGSGGTGGNN
jgi:outer membrane lipoprotein-sorting protein